MSDPVEALLNSPRSIQACKRLGIKKEDLAYLSKEELKVKLGDMKISKADLEREWENYEKERRDKIQKVLAVRLSHLCNCQERKKVVETNSGMQSSHMS